MPHLRRSERELENERAARPYLALDPDPASMCLDDALRDEEPEPRALAAGVVGTPKAIEDARQMLGRDAGSRVTHFEADVEGWILRR